MKGDIYIYENKEFILTGKDFDMYAKRTGVEMAKEYSPEEATKIINKNTLGCYRGIFHCTKPLTGKEICDILSDISEQFMIRCQVVCEENEQ